MLGLVVYTTQAQSFTVTPNPIQLEVDLSNTSNPNELFLESTIVNNTSDTLNLKWERIVNDIPDCWESSVFGVWIAALPHVDAMDFDLAPNEEGLLGLTVFTDPTGGGPSSGEGNVLLKITNLNNTADSLFVEFNISATSGSDCITSVSDLDSENLQLYPNPASTFFHLNKGIAARYLMIYDAGGQQTNRFNIVPDQPYDIGDLEQGIYFIALFNRNDQIVKVLRLVKS